MISIVVPVLNEEDNLTLLHDRLTKVLKDIGDVYEIIYVDDASIDGSWEIIKTLQDAKAIRFTRTFGQKAAVIAGLKITVGDQIITLDADLQNPPEEIPKLLRKLDDGYDVVFGIPDNKKHSLYRKLGTSLGKYIMSKFLSSAFSDWSGFRSLTRKAVDQFKLMNCDNQLLDILLCWMGYRVTSVVVEHNERYKGKSKYNLFKLISLFVDMIISFTNIPLKVSTFAGMLLGIFGFILSVAYVILYFVSNYTVPGFVTTVILISFFSGIQLFCLGILGEYIGRMNTEIKNRPEYIVKEIL